VEEEEEELFLLVESLLDETTLEGLEEEMGTTQEEMLAKGNPRDQIARKTREAAAG